MDQEEFDRLAREILGDGVDIDEEIEAGKAEFDALAAEIIESGKAGIDTISAGIRAGKASRKAPPASSNDPHGPFLRPKQVAARLNLPLRTVYTMLADGRLKGFKIGQRGSSNLITERSVDEFVRAGIERFQIENGLKAAD